MELPAVRYVSTSDGRNIAYTVTGTGIPFVFLPMWSNHAQEIWASTQIGPLLAGLSERFRLVNYDARGTGMSTRGLGEDVTLESYFLDLDAVVSRLGLERFILLGSHSSALLAGHYAARYPERVAALILSSSSPRWLGADLPSFWDDLPRQAWDAFLYAVVPNLSDKEARFVQAVLRRWITQEDYLASTRVWRNAGLDGVIPGLEMPTLVLKPRDCPCTTLDGAIELARLLPNARLALIDGDQPFGTRGEALQVISAFLADIEVDNQFCDTRPEKSAPPAGAPRVGISARQLEVLRLIAQGKTNGEIADNLVISLRTVERHVAELYAKIGVRNRVEAAAFARDRLAVG